MSDYVRVMISIATQWRVAQALGPAALALAGVPVNGPVRRKPGVARAHKRSVKAAGNGQPGNGH